MEDQKVQSSPSFADIAAAMKVLQAPEQPQGIQKHISAIIVAAIIGIGAWMMTSMNTMQTSITQVVTTVASMQKTFDEMSRRADSGTGAQNDMRMNIARLDQRVTQNEQRLTAIENNRGAPNATRYNRSEGRGQEGPSPSF